MVTSIESVMAFSDCKGSSAQPEVLKLVAAQKRGFQKRHMRRQLRHPMGRPMAGEVLGFHDGTPIALLKCAQRP